MKGILTESTIISLLFWLLASVFNAGMDMMFNMYNSSIFTKLGKWFNPYESWVLKWKGGNKINGERFFGSSTFLVWMTDGWHLFKMLFLLSLIISIYYFNDSYMIMTYPLFWFVGFEVTKKLLTIKK